jgi:hypothetical protein
MSFFAAYGKEMVALFVPFITWFLTVGLKAKAKLIWSSPHSFTFLIPEPVFHEGVKVADATTVHTASVRLINSGRETATKVELVFNWKPHYINIWPARAYEEAVDSDKRCTIRFASFAPKEELRVEIMALNAQLPQLLTVRSDQCVAQNVHIRWVPWVPNWRIAVAQFLCLVGLGTLVYWVIVLLQLLVLRTPTP